jgi:carboxylesterase type B
MAPEDSLTTTIRHPDLGELTGRVRNHSPSVVQFRNVPYAHIPARFRQSKIVTPDPAAPAEQRDCTQDGYACPQVPQTLAAFGGKLPGEQDRQQYDEFACLNTIISVPRSVVTSSQVDPGDGVGTGGSDSNSSNTSKKRLLPVLVYVHGGAFSMGAHLGPIHGELISQWRSCYWRPRMWRLYTDTEARVGASSKDTTRMVELSVKEGQPVVIVSIQ